MMDKNKRLSLKWILFQLIVIIDLVLISLDLALTFPRDISFHIHIFDLIVCVLLLIDWFINFYMASSKREFMKGIDNWIDLIASIPFDTILPFLFPHVKLLRYFRLLRLLRVIALFNRFLSGFKKFLHRSSLDKILLAILFSLALFTVLLYAFGLGNNLFEVFYFVVVTIATVGYGDIIPATTNEKIVTIFLIIAGLFIMSTITAAISSYLTDKLIKDDEEEIGKFEDLVEELDSVKKELDEVNRKNDRLIEEMDELKELIKNKK